MRIGEQVTMARLADKVASLYCKEKLSCRQSLSMFQNRCCHVIGHDCALCKNENNSNHIYKSTRSTSKSDTCKPNKA